MADPPPLISMLRWPAATSAAPIGPTPPFFATSCRSLPVTRAGPRPWRVLNPRLGRRALARRGGRGQRDGARADVRRWLNPTRWRDRAGAAGPGEISLAHRGRGMLDEQPEFSGIMQVCPNVQKSAAFGHFSDLILQQYPLWHGDCDRPQVFAT
jgi:hypothetical protein